MKDDVFISDKKVEKLARKLSKALNIQSEEAMELIYEEWDLVETLFHQHKKVKAVVSHLVDEVNYTYRIA